MVAIRAPGGGHSSDVDDLRDRCAGTEGERNQDKRNDFGRHHGGAQHESLVDDGGMRFVDGGGVGVARTGSDVASVCAGVDGVAGLGAAGDRRIHLG